MTASQDRRASAAAASAAAPDSGPDEKPDTAKRTAEPQSRRAAALRGETVGPGRGPERDASAATQPGVHGSPTGDGTGPAGPGKIRRGVFFKRKLAREIQEAVESEVAAGEPAVDQPGEAGPGEAASGEAAPAEPESPAPHAGTAGAETRERAGPAESPRAAAEGASTPADRGAPGEAGAATQAEWLIAPSAVDFVDPLLSCVTTLAGLLQRPISAEAIAAGLPHAADRFTPELAVRAAERAGLEARITRRPKLRQILPVTLPCILLLKGGNACVLLGYPDRRTAEIVTPEGGTGKRTVDFETLAAQYTGYAIFARPEFRFDQRAADIRLSQPRAWFWGTLARFWPIYSHVLLASTLINCFAIASPLFIMNVYDRVVPNNAIETLWALAIGVAIVFCFEFVMRNLRTYFVDVAGKNADVLIASRLLEQLMSMKLANKGPSTGAMANNLREFESLREFFTSGTVVALVDLPFIFLFIGVIWLVATTIALIPLVVVPMVILVGMFLQFPLRRVVERTQRESTQKHAILVETIDGLETIKATAAEGRVQRAWERFVGLTAESSGKARFISGLATTFAQVSIQLSTVAVVVYGVYRIGDGEITMGALIASTILTGRALAPLSSIAAMLTRLQQSRVALRALDVIMKAPVERPADKTFLHRPLLSGQVELRQVSFSYPGQTNPALDGISLKINSGERIGVLGRIGSGKSTIARLLIGLYEPAEGAVLMDSTDIRQIDPADLRRNVGYVSQDNYLFFGSVRDNIAFGAPHLDDRAILRAAHVAGVTDFLRTHPLGLDLQVGERGMGLSGGQRQSIVIARALLLDPPIIVLDEPTSNMDNSTEAVFKNRLSQIVEGKTLILITHRSSLLSLVDRLVIVDSGKVVADGPKEEVLAALKQGQIRAANA